MADTSTGKTQATDAARLIAKTMQDLIGHPVGLDDDFFAVGGHSLAAMKLLGRLRRKGLTLEIADIITHKTPNAIAAALGHESAASSAAESSSTDYDANEIDELFNGEVVLPLSRGEGVPLFCFHSIIGLAWSYAPLAKRLAGRCPVIGIQVPSQQEVMTIGFEHDDLCRFYIEKMKKIQPHGPYRLVGYSSGGSIAHTIAGMLQQEGEKVDVVVMIDAYPSGVQPDCPGGVAAAMAMFLGSHDTPEGQQPIAPVEEEPAVDEGKPGERGEEFWDSFEEEDNGEFDLIPELNDNHIRGMIEASGAPEFSHEEIQAMIDAAGRALMYYLSATPWTYDGKVTLILANDDGRIPGVIWDPKGAWEKVQGADRVDCHRINFQHLALISDGAWAAMAPIISGALDEADANSSAR